jgi:hypothetical protein
VDNQHRYRPQPRRNVERFAARVETPQGPCGGVRFVGDPPAHENDNAVNGERGD